MSFSMKPVSPTNTFLPLRQQPSCQAFSRLILAEQAAPAAPDLLLAVPTVCARHSRDPCQRCKNRGARASHANEENPSASPPQAQPDITYIRALRPGSRPPPIRTDPYPRAGGGVARTGQLNR